VLKFVFDDSPLLSCKVKEVVVLASHSLLNRLFHNEIGRPTFHIFIKYIALTMLIIYPIASIQAFFFYDDTSPTFFLAPTLASLIIGSLLANAALLKYQLQHKSEQFRAIADLAQEFTYLRSTDGRYEYISPSCIDLTGYDQQTFYDTPNLMNQLIHPDDMAIWKRHMHSVNNNGTPESFDLRLLSKDGSTVWFNHTCMPVSDKENQQIGVRSTNLDITKRKKIEEKLSYQSLHDDLTGLFNRREFKRLIQEMLTSNVHDKTEHALCYIDLDQFKVVNDTCGHAAGDEMLRQLSVVLKKVIRASDTLARLGGDEFGILMTNCAIEDAYQIASLLQTEIQNYYFQFEEHRFRVTGSIGLVPIVGRGSTLTGLLKDADAACYMAKDSGRNRIHVYHIDDEDLTQRHSEMQWVKRIQQALTEDRFCLYAQSIESLNNSDKMHYELLIRMQDEHGRIVPPGAFLPAAERYNLIVQVDRWVIDNAFRLLEENPRILDEVDFISINLSGHSLTDVGVLDFIISKLKQYSVDGNRFCFEITETAAISHLLLAENFIIELKKFGCRFALDDFGSGLSSFGYLKNLPVDYLKIDGVFVKDMMEDKIDYAMVKAINQIGHIMGMQTIAEFVEHDKTKHMLKEMGVDYAQGYAIHKPQPFHEILKLTLNNVSDS
jgi:diguanylate cyclase (GGDEF)-like protein/PAS domain S-box-containing protein